MVGFVLVLKSRRSENELLASSVRSSKSVAP